MNKTDCMIVPFFATSNQGVHFLMSLLTFQISTALFLRVRVDWRLREISN